MKRILYIAVLLMALAIVACSTEDILEKNTGRTVTVSLSMHDNNSETRVGVSTAEGSLGLSVAFEANDKFDVYVRQGDKIVEIEEVTFAVNENDRKRGRLTFEMPASVNASKEYTLYGVCGISSGIRNGRLVIDGNAACKPVGDFQAPLWFEYTGTGNTVSPRCQFMGTYIVIHLKNKAESSALFQVDGLVTDALFDDIYWDENTRTFSEDFGVSPTSPALSIAPNASGTFIYNAIPNGKTMQTLNVGLHIGETITWNMDIINAETPKQVGKVLQQGRAYHLYLTWNGKRLQFGDGDSQGYYQTSSYILSEDRKTLVKWLGDETDIDLTKDPAFDNVTTIGEYAFAYRKMISLNLPVGTTRIEESAFSGCRSLASIIIPEGVTYIGEFVFFECDNLKTVKLPHSLKEMGKGIFSTCGIETIEIPRQITKIPEHCFRNSGPYLKEITLHEGITEIGQYAFFDCVGLNSPVLPNSVKTIGEHAFCYCKFESISMPAELEFLGERAFYQCTYLKNINIPNGVKTIYEYTFYECGWLVSVSLPESLEEIEANAFDDCWTLTTINWPKNLKSIGERAFYGCYFSELTLPDKLETIGTSAFSGCQELKTLSLPNSLKVISDYAFSGCYNLTDVYAHMTTIPETGTDVFFSTSNSPRPKIDRTLYVPKANGVIDLYRNNAPWSSFKTIIASEEY